MLERPVLRNTAHLRLRCCHHHQASKNLDASFVRLYNSVNRPTPQFCRRTPLFAHSRFFQSSSAQQLDILADADKGKDKEAQSHNWPKEEAPLSDEEYHERSDEYIEGLLEKLEAMAEEKADMDVEYSAGVLTIDFPPAGTYVLNKQPPNKQIWLSSPTSGPKRFNWVVVGDSMNQKEGTGAAEWVYLKDGTTLSDLMRAELGIHVGLIGED